MIRIRRKCFRGTNMRNSPQKCKSVWRRIHFPAYHIRRLEQIGIKKSFLCDISATVNRTDLCARQHRYLKRMLNWNQDICSGVFANFWFRHVIPGSAEGYASLSCSSPSMVNLRVAKLAPVRQFGAALGSLTQNSRPPNR